MISKIFVCIIATIFILNFEYMLSYVSGLTFIEYTSWQIMNSGVLQYKYLVAEIICILAFLFLLYPKYLNSDTIKKISKIEILFGSIIFMIFVYNVSGLTYDIWNAGVLLAEDNVLYGYNDIFGFISQIIVVSVLLYIIVVGNLSYLSKSFYVEGGKIYAKSGTKISSISNNFYIKNGRVYAKKYLIFKIFREK